MSLVSAYAGRNTWYVDQIVLKTPIFTKVDNDHRPAPEKVEFEVVKTCALELHDRRIVIRDVLSGKVMSYLNYSNMHSFEANHCLFWITTCRCTSVPASLHYFVVTTGETAALLLLQDLKDSVLLSCKPHQATLFPIEAKARHVATVAVDNHEKCDFPQNLSPLKVGRKLSEGLLPLCKGLTDRLCITRRTGNCALLCGYVPRDYMEKYAPKGPSRHSMCSAAEKVHAPLFVLPKRNRIPIRGPSGAEKVASDTYPCLSSTGTCAAAASNAEDPYITMKPADMLTYLELLPEGVPLSLGEPDQLKAEDAVAETREGEEVEDCRGGSTRSEDSVLDNRTQTEEAVPDTKEDDGIQ